MDPTFDLSDFTTPHQCVPVMAALSAFLATLSGAERHAWSERLRAFLAQPGPSTADMDDPDYLTGILAAALCCWGLATECFERSLSRTGEHAATLYNLAVSCQQRGRWAQARHALTRAIELAPACTLYGEQLTALDRRAVRQAERLPGSVTGPGRLSLGLLERFHAQALVRHLGDARVASSAGLPRLVEVSMARAWIRQQWAQAEEGSALPLVLLHEEHGLVGAAALQRPSQDGRSDFHYWVGGDFQGQGCGTLLVHLLSRLAAWQGALWLCGYVAVDNIASARVLRRSGFQRDPDCATFWRKSLSGAEEWIDAGGA